MAVERTSSVAKWRSSCPHRGFLSVLVLLTTVIAPPVWSQAILNEQMMEIGDYVLGDWHEITVDRPKPVIHIRLVGDGTFLHGTDQNFGRYPMSWEAERITPLPRQVLTVNWADNGQCSYYVDKIRKDGKEFMVWSPYKDYRNFGAFGGVLTRALLVYSRCRDMMWARNADDPRPIGPPESDPPYPE